MDLTEEKVNFEGDNKPTNDPSGNKFRIKNVVIIVGVLVLVVIGLLTARYFFKPIAGPGFDFNPFNNNKPDVAEVEKFESEDDFRDYLVKAADVTNFSGGVMPMAEPMVMREMAQDVDFGMNMNDSIGLSQTSKTAPSGLGSGSPDRVSETNVQVAGIDEPDMVKTDGKEIYASLGYRYYYNDLPTPRVDLNEVMVDSIAPQQRRQGGVQAMKAWPPADLELEGSIDKQGDLLLFDDVLMVFSGSDVIGYDVSDPTDPEEKWDISIENNSYLITSRLYDETLYLISRTRINMPKPCPFIPLEANSEGLSIACTDIYHPIVPIDVDSTYTITKIDPVNGEVLESTSFVGSQSSSAIYMSESSIYISYVYPGDVIAFVLDFFIANGDLIDNTLVGRLRKLKTYELSHNAKMTELTYILSQYLNGLDDDEKLRVESEMENRMEDFSKEYMRKLEQTGIVKIDNNKLKVEGVGVVPGRLLNQFSLDEYDKHLRVATTISGNFNTFGFFGSRQPSANDVYVLNDSMKVVGEVLDLGLTERIYSARFVRDKGYIVTFRQTDPFYVIDLSDPKNPEMKGELKIPGYSSYLHPLNDDLVVGIGKEGSKVKISLFDVSDPSDPKEVDKYIMDEYWSEVLSTHHAFLPDTDNEIFFMPGSKGGYIFSYSGNELVLTKAVSNIKAKRALYLDNYLYIIGQDKLVVLNQSDWERINELDY